MALLAIVRWGGTFAHSSTYVTHGELHSAGLLSVDLDAKRAPGGRVRLLLLVAPDGVHAAVWLALLRVPGYRGYRWAMSCRRHPRAWERRLAASEWRSG